MQFWQQIELKTVILYCNIGNANSKMTTTGFLRITNDMRIMNSVDNKLLINV